MKVSQVAQSSEFSLTVSRALQLLCVFDHSKTELGISELSRELALSKPAVQRLVHALERHQFLEQNGESRKYRIGVQAFRIGALFAGGQQLERIALPSMQLAVQELGMTCYLSVLRNDAMVITAAIEGAGPIRHSIPIGGRLDVHCSAVGKAALSVLPAQELDAVLSRIKLQRRTSNTIVDREGLRADLKAAAIAGYSINWEENSPGVASVAAPIQDQDGRLVAVISIGFASSQLPRKQMPELGKRLVSLARKISQQLAGATPRRAA